MGCVHVEASFLGEGAALLCVELPDAVEAMEGGKEGPGLRKVRLRVERVGAVEAGLDEREGERAEEGDELVGGEGGVPCSGCNHRALSICARTAEGETRPSWTLLGSFARPTSTSGPRSALARVAFLRDTQCSRLLAGLPQPRGRAPLSARSRQSTTLQLASTRAASSPTSPFTRACRQMLCPVRPTRTE